MADPTESTLVDNRIPVFLVDEVMKNPEIVNRWVEKLYEVINARDIDAKPYNNYWYKMEWNLQPLSNNDSVPLARERVIGHSGSPHSMLLGSDYYWLLTNLGRDAKARQFLYFEKANKSIGDEVVKYSFMGFDVIEDLWKAGLPIALKEFIAHGRFVNARDTYWDMLRPIKFLDFVGQEIVLPENTGLYKLPAIVVKNPHSSGTIIQLGIGNVPGSRPANEVKIV